MIRIGAARLLVAAAVLAGLVTGCGDSGDGKAAPPAETAGFPVSLPNAWGTTKIDKRPTRVATVSEGDTSIALALGLTPVIAPDSEQGEPLTEYKKRALDGLGIAKLKTYKTTDGTDYEAIAAEAPDVILAVNSWQMDTDYAKLTPIAPVVTFANKQDADTLPWQDRLRTAAKALGMTGKAEQIVRANEKTVSDAVAAHPEFKGKTYAYAVVHPEQITYMSYADQDPGVFELLGLRKAPQARKYTAKANSVSLENLDHLDADLLLVAYPFGDEGLLSKSELESNKIFQSIPAVRAKRFAVLPTENGLAATLAYPDALSLPWVVQQLTPILAGIASAS
ncbi:ABC transporter substrate-binding protein [Actinomadura syzygii]|nr:ABC transporter substrate-binding protein [Actinomadura syzygii]